jgi:hypothetical protein
MKNNTSLANFMIEDGQVLRSIYNYIQSTYDEIEGKEFEFDQVIYTNRLDFYKSIHEGVRLLIEHELESLKEQS